VIQDAAWGVFLENYQKGYGADGDHLKTFRKSSLPSMQAYRCDPRLVREIESKGIRVLKGDARS